MSFFSFLPAAHFCCSRCLLLRGIIVLTESSGTAVATDSAIGSSMAGASVSLVDFFVDAIGLFSKEGHKTKTEQRQEVDSGMRTLAAAMALGPPVLISYAFPDAFLTALEEAGLLGGVSLYGLIPALCLLSFRSSVNDDNSEMQAMPGRLGGKYTLFIILAISAALVFPEIVHVAGLVTQ